MTCRNPKHVHCHSGKAAVTDSQATMCDNQGVSCASSLQPDCPCHMRAYGPAGCAASPSHSNMQHQAPCRPACLQQRHPLVLDGYARQLAEAVQAVVPQLAVHLPAGHPAG